MLLVHDRRIQGQHPQQGQGAEHDEAVAVQVLHQAQQLLPLTLQHLLVEPAVLGLQRDPHHLFLLLGKVRGHHVLGTAQHEGPDPTAQP